MSWRGANELKPLDSGPVHSTGADRIRAANPRFAPGLAAGRARGRFRFWTGDNLNNPDT